MGLRDKLVTCSELEDKGVWFDVLDTGTEFLCRRFHGGNAGAMTAYQEAIEPYFREGADGETGDYDLTSDEAEDTLCRVWAEHVITNWRGVTEYDVYGEGHDDVEPLEYTPEHCVALMKSIPEVFIAVSTNAAKRENYLLIRRKARVGNS